MHKRKKIYLIDKWNKRDSSEKKAKELENRLFRIEYARLEEQRYLESILIARTQLICDIFNPEY